MNFNNNKWIQFHSNKEFADKYRIFRLNEDEEICFFIQYASRAYCSDYIMFTIAAAISDRGKLPYNNNTVYKAYVNINYDTGEASLSENSVNPELRNHGIGSLGLEYIKDFCKSQNCKSISGQKRPQIPFDEEEMEALTHFYIKNGFQQLPNDMIKYEF